VADGAGAVGSRRRAVAPDRASTFVISITPFDTAGGLDHGATRAHLQRMAEGGVGVYLGGGGSGEGYVLTPAESRRLLEIGVEELTGRVPVRAMGTEPRSAAEMVSFVESVSDLGLDAVQVYSLDQGHGHRPTPAEIRRYFCDVLDAVAVPVVLSTHQSVGYQVPVPLLSELADTYPHLIGVNSSHQDLGYLTAVVDAVGDRLTVHVGGPHLALTAMAVGASGFLTSEGNLAPRLCAAVIDAYRRDHAQEMASRFGVLLRLSGALYGAGGIRATKAVLASLGLPGGTVRLPQLPVEPQTVVRLRDLLAELGVAEVEGW